MGLKQFLVGFALVLLFTVAIINFATWFAIDNNAPVSLADDSELSLIETGADSRAISYNIEVNKSLEAFQKSEITDESETTRTGAFFKLKPQSLEAFEEILRVGYKKLFGTGSAFSIILMTILGLIGVVFGMLIWKAWKGGQVE